MSPDLVVESVRAFATFFIQEKRLPVAETGAGQDELLEAERPIPTFGETTVSQTTPVWAVATVFGP